MVISYNSSKQCKTLKEYVAECEWEDDLDQYLKEHNEEGEL